MTVHQDPEFELLFEFYERVDRKAPGSRATTKRAWSLLEGLPSEPRIVDLGCGAGASALVLAECGADVTAVDVHEPFLKRLRDLAVAAGSADRITTVQADMADPPLPDGGFDVVWSEGAIYLVGFAAGLARWRRLLRPEGWIAVSEATWLVDSPPAEAVDYWAVEYPAMTTIEGNLQRLRAAGFAEPKHFTFPAADYSEEYFAPVRAELDAFRSSRAEDPRVPRFVDATLQEIDHWRRYGHTYGYVFYVARTAADARVG